MGRSRAVLARRRRNEAGRPRRRLLALLGAGSLITALVLAVLAAVLWDDEEAALEAPPTAEGTAGQVRMIVSVVPIGGNTPRGIQTRESALAEIDEALDQGAVGIRLNVDIRWLCPDETCDTEPLAPLVEHAKAREMAVYLHVNSTPTWIDERGRWYAPLGRDADRWARLFAQFVQRYGSSVDGYEVWNEPNNPSAWEQEPDADQYADLLKAVWTQSKAVAPSAQIIGAVLSNNDLGYMHQLSQALEARGGNASNRYYYDLLGVHPYTGDRGIGFDPGLPPGERSVQTSTGEKDMTFRGVERLRAQVAADEGIWRDVVIGEFGYDSTPGNWYYVPEDVRADYLVSALTISGEWPWLRGITIYGWNGGTWDGFSLDGTASERAVRELMSR